MKIAVCDDNELQLELTCDILRDILAEELETPEISSFTGGRQLMETVRSSGGFDLYILDVYIPDMNGMEIATTLRMMKDDGYIIFLSSSLDYAVQSYDVEAFYYFLKPIDRDKFARVIRKAAEKIGQKGQNDTLYIPTQDGVHAVRVPDVAYVTVEDRRVKYALRDGRFILGRTVRGKFREEVAELKKYPVFLECGVSMLVNAAMIDVIDGESVLLSNGELLYTSHNAAAVLKRQMDAVRQGG